jgi:hypothetical protein
MKAVVDRFEGDWAVLLAADRQQIVVPRKKLPEGTAEGHHLQVILQDGRVTQAVIDEPATEDARCRIQAKLDSLRRGDHLTD